MAKNPVAEADRLWLRLCPTCHGEQPAMADCLECEQTGMFDERGQPFQPMPPFDTWTPAKLVALSDQHWAEPANVSASRPKRLTQNQLVERLLHALGRGGQDHSSFKLVRNAKADTQIEVIIRAEKSDPQSITEARELCEAEYDHLCRRYPPPGLDVLGR